MVFIGHGLATCVSSTTNVCCLSLEQGFICGCQEPYIGQRCEVINYCSRNPCLNGGLCKNVANGFECLCSPSHHGRSCEILNPCRYYISQFLLHFPDMLLSNNTGLNNTFFVMTFLSGGNHIVLSIFKYTGFV